MQTPEDFRRGAVTLANLKGPLRTAQNHVERRVPDLKAIGPVASTLQDNFLGGLDMMTRRSTYLLELQVIEAMKRAVQVEEAAALGQGIGWAVPENPTRHFLQDLGGSQSGELTGWEQGGSEQAGIREGGCQVPKLEAIVQVDPKYAPQFVALARRKFAIATDILHTATDTLAPLGLDLGPCAAINEVMRRYEALAAFVQRVASQILIKDRLGPFLVPGESKTVEAKPYERTPLEPKSDSDDQELVRFMTATPYLKRDRSAGGVVSNFLDGGSLLTPDGRPFAPPSGTAQPWRSVPDAPSGWTRAAMTPPSGSATPWSRPSPPADLWSAPSVFLRRPAAD